MLGAIIVVVVLGSLVVLHFEKPTNPEIQTYGDAVWLSFVTMTTVGYGDVVPITPGGRATVIVMMVLGVTLLTGFIGIQASARAEKALRRAKGLDQKSTLHDHFVVCGWNQRGKYVLTRLAYAARDGGIPIALLCVLEESPLDDNYVFFYKGSPTNATDQKRVNMENARSVILLADENMGGDPSDVDARTVLAALTARALNPSVNIVAEVLEPENVAHIMNAGVEEVFDHNLIGGNLLAQAALHKGIIEVVNAMAQKDADEKMHRIPVGPELVGKTCSQATTQLEADKGYTIIGFKRADTQQFCDTDTVLSADDEIIILSRDLPDEPTV